MSEVVNLSQASGNGFMQSPEQALQEALEYIGKKGAFENGKKLLVLCVDDLDENYSVSWIQAGMKMSECISLVDIAKSQFKREMNY